MDLRRVNLQLLSQLDVLVKERHVTRAAERLGITQPTMSASLSKLRELFQDPLLVKTSHGMEPTTRGLELAQRARHVIDLIEERNPAVAFDPGSCRGQFSIFTTEAISRALVPALTKRVREDAPALRLTVLVTDVGRPQDHLRDGDCDLAVGYLRQPPPDLRYMLLFSQPIKCLASGTHPSIRGSLNVERFVAFPHVLWGPRQAPQRSIERMVDDALARRGLTRSHWVRVPNLLVVPEVVAATDMIAVVPSRIAEQGRRELGLQALAPPLRLEKSEVRMFWHERTHRDPMHNWLRGVVRQAAQAASV